MAVFNNYVSGNSLRAADLNSYASKQMVMSFDNQIARDTALSSVIIEGMASYQVDVSQLSIYNGSTWIRQALSIDVVAADTRSVYLQLYM